ncbi:MULTISPECIES: FtsW/RodA/SpoVE family cell cycle protein [Bacillaceae]|uniref:Probable peptidoglycan glycosyltransferase FtsW n=2 Tax=Bacillus infantis TaxID=324767 RepID=U5L8L6_9BACI|nr:MULTISPECIES: FtsW/RodA/SpoVE family cell cycle protein [Bacillus]OXT16573.1 cell division protein FtsW [Bacillus sp. OG2]AGX03708.1 cell division protein FtsW [Bacillus infantis NRRL B-14911]EAR64828.1 cell-division protein [Bacillus sp. NRRL B-14911]MCA1034544.1 FtsW/RodA/SpoVE family cell cycle protein [Bacillus infantis]MCK6204009.1 FtsW/RodA/SpoVE family cell cycle protein [Bacillus infantis]
MFKKILKSYDYTLIAVVVMLALFGLIMIYSASMVTAVQRYGFESDHFYQRQKIYLLGAALVFIFTALFPYKALISNKILVPMVFGSLIGLGALFIFGHVAGNAQSWFKLGPLSLQPSEFVKIFVIIYLSAVYAKKQSYIDQFNKGVVPPLVYLILVCMLVAVQPDFGTAAIIFLISATIILSSGMSYKNILKLCLIAFIIALPFILIMNDKLFSDVQMARIQVLQDPFADAQNDGYHLVNSFLALGAGGVKGLGLGQSVQKLGYLPEPHTDFIMAVIAEELGAFGVCFVLLSLGYIVLRGLYIGMKCKDPFGSLLAIGIAGMIGIQSFINLGGISGVIPLTGVPLPFVSYGGSSLLQLSIAMGILVNVSMFVNYESKYKNRASEKQAEQNQKVSGGAYFYKK